MRILYPLVRRSESEGGVVAIFEGLAYPLRSRVSDTM